MDLTLTPEQGGRLTDIECFINKQISEDFIDGFQPYTPREVRKQQEQPSYSLVPGRSQQGSPRTSLTAGACSRP